MDGLNFAPKISIGNTLSLVIVLFVLLLIISYSKNFRLGLTLFGVILMIALIEGAVPSNLLYVGLLFAIFAIVIFWDDIIKLKIPVISDLINKFDNISLFNSAQLQTIPSTDPRAKQALERLYSLYAKPGEVYYINTTETNHILDTLNPDLRSSWFWKDDYAIEVEPKPLAYFIINKPLTYNELGTFLINKNQWIQSILLPDGTHIGILLPAKLVEKKVNNNETHISPSTKSDPIKPVIYSTTGLVGGEILYNLLNSI